MRNITWYIIGAIAFILLGVLVLTSPAFVKAYDLTPYTNLANSINGLTSPLIGLISAFLLFLALSRQTEANKQFKTQMDTDITFALMQQVDKYIEQFYFTVTSTNTKTSGNVSTVTRDVQTHTGFLGINKFADFMKQMTASSKGLGDFYQTSMVLLIIRSLDQMEVRLTESHIDPSVRKSFQNKIDILKDTALIEPLKTLLTAVDNKKLKEDSASIEIRQFAGQTDKQATLNFLTGSEANENLPAAY